VALVLLAGCHKKTDIAASGGSGSAVAVGSGSATVATPTPPQDPGKALDAALAAKHVGADAVKKQIASATSAWAVVVGKSNDADEVVELDVIAARADGIAEVQLVPPAGTKPATFGDVASFEAQDLDGNGSDEGLLVVNWSRNTTVPGEEKGYAVMTDEQVRELYVLAGAAPTLKPAFTHVVSYESHSEGMPEDNVTPYPEDETVTYDWSVVPGPQPAVKLTRTKSEVAAKDRLKGALDPVTDPLFAAGAGKDVPLTLK
jgi:hypothetical protein